MLKWLDSTAAAKQADDAVVEIEQLVPQSELSGWTEKRSKQMQKLERTINKHRRQYSSAGYNIYQKAKFANRVKWSLRDKGYPNDFIDSLVRLLII
jgi:hypothetical protein